MQNSKISRKKWKIEEKSEKFRKKRKKFKKKVKNSWFFKKKWRKIKI